MTEYLRPALWLAAAVFVFFIGMRTTAPKPSAYVARADGSVVDLSRYKVSDGYDFTALNGDKGLLIGPGDIVWDRPYNPQFLWRSL